MSWIVYHLRIVTVFVTKDLRELFHLAQESVTRETVQIVHTVRYLNEGFRDVIWVVYLSINYLNK